MAEIEINPGATYNAARKATIDAISQAIQCLDDQAMALRQQRDRLTHVLHALGGEPDLPSIAAQVGNLAPIPPTPPTQAKAAAKK